MPLDATSTSVAESLRMAEIRERAYRAGWSASMQWLPREVPEGMDAEAWNEGYTDAMDAPLGSAVPWGAWE